MYFVELAFGSESDDSRLGRLTARRCFAFVSLDWFGWLVRLLAVQAVEVTTTQREQQANQLGTPAEGPRISKRRTNAATALPA